VCVCVCVCVCGLTLTLNLANHKLTIQRSYKIKSLTFSFDVFEKANVDYAIKTLYSTLFVKVFFISKGH